MNKEELKNKLFEMFVYNDGESDKLSYDYCQNCESFIVQKEYDGIFACEHCESQNISIVELDEEIK